MAGLLAECGGAFVDVLAAATTQPVRLGLAPVGGVEGAPPCRLSGVISPLPSRPALQVSKEPN